MTTMSTLDPFLRRIVGNREESRIDLYAWGIAYSHLPETDITPEGIRGRVAELVAEREQVEIIRNRPEDQPE